VLIIAPKSGNVGGYSFDVVGVLDRVCGFIVVFRYLGISECTLWSGLGLGAVAKLDWGYGCVYLKTGAKYLAACSRPGRTWFSKVLSDLVAGAFF
jgi:hypothetical protein